MLVILTLLVGRQEGNLACTRLGVGLLLVTFDWSFAKPYVSMLAPSPPSPLAPTVSRMETFWYWITEVHLTKWPLKRRDRKEEVMQWFSHVHTCLFVYARLHDKLQMDSDDIFRVINLMDCETVKYPPNDGVESLRGPTSYVFAYVL